ncbi:MAG: hypothetical protein U1E16_05190 [Hyphomicrobiales bacterium]|uniref:hypothetical protein n=1 Tax=Aestuariivirga sp. TaxID=2650926 RepID=UPI0035B15919
MTAIHDTSTITERDVMRRHREPRFMPLDIMAFGVGALMTLGPLAAAALFN